MGGLRALFDPRRWFRRRPPQPQDRRPEFDVADVPTVLGGPYASGEEATTLIENVGAPSREDEAPTLLVGHPGAGQRLPWPARDGHVSAPVAPPSDGSATLVIGQASASASRSVPEGPAEDERTRLAVRPARGGSQSRVAPDPEGSSDPPGAAKAGENDATAEEPPDATVLVEPRNRAHRRGWPPQVD